MPLADLVENRRLILITLGLTAAALVALAIAPSAGLFLIAAATVGCFSAARSGDRAPGRRPHPGGHAGRTIGAVMSGLLAGSGWPGRRPAWWPASPAGGRCSGFRPC